MKALFLILILNLQVSLMASTTNPSTMIRPTSLMTKEMQEQNPNIPVCQFARKDYDSPGFGITYRDGFYIKGTFGCVYYCGCNEKAYYVTHVYKNEYFDSEIWSKETGGPKRAKWFICPHSVDEDSWKGMYAEIGRLIGYQVEEDRSFFEPRQSTMSALAIWSKSSCH